ALQVLEPGLDQLVQREGDDANRLDPLLGLSRSDCLLITIRSGLGAVGAVDDVVAAANCVVDGPHELPAASTGVGCERRPGIVQAEERADDVNTFGTAKVLEA